MQEQGGIDDFSKNRSTGKLNTEAIAERIDEKVEDMSVVYSLRSLPVEGIQVRSGQKKKPQGFENIYVLRKKRGQNKRLK